MLEYINFFYMQYKSTIIRKVPEKATEMFNSFVKVF